MSWGERSIIKELREEKQWVINILKTICELQREPTKEDLQKIVTVLEAKK